MKSALVLVFSNLKHDARVTRQVHWLRQHFQVTVVCFDSEEIPGVKICRVKQTALPPVRKALLATLLLLKQYTIAYRVFHDYGRQLGETGRLHYDLIVANDIDALPLAFSLQGTKILFDAHEYAPRHFENNRIWKIFFQPFYVALCRKYIPRVDAMLTVGKGLADEYAANFGVRPVIITNAPEYTDIAPSPVEPGRIRLVHHGIANQSRRLELMIDMMQHLDERFSLDLMLMTSDYASQKTKQYIKTLKERAEKNARVRVLPAVRSSEVVATINRYDIGVFLLPPVNFNYANTLPNKLFDFIQARLGIAIGPSPEMAAIVRTFGNGVIAENFDPLTLANALNALGAGDVAQLKQQSAAAAKMLNAGKNAAIFNEVIEKICGPPQRNATA